MEVNNDCLKKVVGLYYKNIVGQIFGDYQVVKFLNINSKGRAVWLCKCIHCGKERECIGKYLTAKKCNYSCSCTRIKFNDVTNKNFGFIHVCGFAYIENNETYWNCNCRNCGKNFILRRSKLHRNISCGCLHHRKGKDNPFFQDITGKQFGNLIAVNHVQDALWEFKCLYCGEISVHNSYDVKLGKIKSCGCLNIAHSGSKIENDIRKWVDSLVDSISVKDRQILNGKEIDMYYPDFHVGIEYNGSPYHASLNAVYMNKPKLYHRDKFLACKEQGIHLISIFDVDWQNSQEKIKMYLRSLFTKQKRLFARKCGIRKIEKRLADSFTDEYHIQGRTRQNSINYGLYCNDELYAVMSFGTLRMKKTQDGEYELHRYCVKDGYTILGGAEKLSDL